MASVRVELTDAEQAALRILAAKQGLSMRAFIHELVMAAIVVDTMRGITEHETA